MHILGIETSCDETAVAIVEDGHRVRSSIISSSQKLFSKTGGVIPEEAARKQVEFIIPVLHECLLKAQIDHTELDAIAITYAPGLLGSLLVGTTTARVLSAVWNVPLIPVHHTRGHLDSIYLHDDKSAYSEPQFPCLTLSVSGGHSDVWLRESSEKNTLIGTTRDDAAGEAFDKGAAMLGLPYPGGPSISRAAIGGDEHAFAFPLPLHDEETCDFSFSGLKTSLKYTIAKLSDADCTKRLADLAASYQYAICHHLIASITHAIILHPDIKEIHIVGGVSANARLKELMRGAIDASIAIRSPLSISYCTDNGAMIAAAAYRLYQKQPSRKFLTMARAGILEY